ncbi:MAG: hypothetical protein HY075_00445 [Deltaproteobacteria bacterium]|nr:hypothetical protein [Deltaproteobacteria bacterium]
MKRLSILPSSPGLLHDRIEVAASRAVPVFLRDLPGAHVARQVEAPRRALAEEVAQALFALAEERVAHLSHGVARGLVFPFEQQHHRALMALPVAGIGESGGGREQGEHEREFFHV